MAAANLTVSSVSRPHRALVLVPFLEDVLTWEPMFLSALRAQTLIWGGQCNLPVPWGDDTLEHPLFWALARALDPDALIVHRVTLADLEHFDPVGYQDGLAQRRQALRDQGFDDEIIDPFLEKERRAQLVEAHPSDAQEARILEVAACLHHDDHVLSGFASTLEGPGFPFVDVLDLQDGALPEQVAQVCAPSWIEGQLAIAAEAGQLPPDGPERLAAHSVVAGDAREISGEGELAAFLHQVRHWPGPPWPFALAESGLGWYSQGVTFDQPVYAVAGSTAWDFSLFYALRRLTGAAFWVPERWATSAQWLGELGGAPTKMSNHAGELVVTSVSSPELAGQVVSGLWEHANVRATSADYLQTLPHRPRRHLVKESVGLSQSLPWDEPGELTSLFAAARPAIRSRRDPMDLHWMTDVLIDGWTPVVSSRLNASLVDGHGLGSYQVRAVAGGVSYQSPRALVMATEPLENQVVRPRLRPLPVEEQVAVIALSTPWTPALSDKGLYAAQAAQAVGGQPRLIEMLTARGWHELLLALSSTKQSGLPGRWLKAERRRVFGLTDLQALLSGAQLETSAEALVADGILQRGLLHKCARCRWEGWYLQNEIASSLRCARCRKPLSLEEPGWIGEGEPAWFYRLDETLWQFCDNNGQLPLRAAATLIGDEYSTTLIGHELQFTGPGSRKVEVDICAIDDGRLWIGEARMDARLGTNLEDARHKLERLRTIAEALGADGLLLVSQVGFSDDTERVARETLEHAWRWELRIETCPAPA